MFDSPQLYPKMTGQRPYFRDRPAVRSRATSAWEAVVSPSESDLLAVMRIARQLSRRVIKKYCLRAAMPRRFGRPERDLVASPDAPISRFCSLSALPD
jgi:hypothetical protein